jgi:phosphatidylinositol alpha-mannosyltransferase
MRIAMVCPYDWSVDGGVKSHITQLAGYFREWGHEVTIFAPASAGGDAEGARVVPGRPYAVPANGSVARISFRWPTKAVKSALAEGNFDIVHLHEPLVPLLPYVFLRHSSAVNVGTFHAAQEGGRRIYGYSRPLTRRWFRKLHGKIAVSPAAVSLVSRYFRGYFNVIPNGIDYPYWSQTREALPEFQDGRLNILFVGRPEKRKGLRYLLNAYSLLSRERDDLRLIVVGAGDFSGYASSMKDDENVVFRPHVPYEELPRYHASAHVFCCPNTGGESQGYVLMEALAAGLPVVASNIEGFAAVVTDEVDALLTPPRDDAALAGALRRLLDDAPLRERLAKEGQRRAATYNWENVARRVLSYYERLLYERRQIDESLRQHESTGQGVVQ